MKMIRLHRLITLICIIGVSAMMALAERVTKGDVTIEYEPLADGGIKVINVWNKGDKKIELNIDGNIIRINDNSSVKLTMQASKLVRYDFPTGSGYLLWKPTPKTEPVVVESATAVIESPDDKVVINEPKEDRQPTHSQPKEDRQPSHNNKPIDEKSKESTTIDYVDRLNQDDFFGLDAVTAYVQKVDALCRSIDASKNKRQFIIDNDIEQFIEDSETENSEKRQKMAYIAQEIVSTSKVAPERQATTMTYIIETLTTRLKPREEACEKLKTLVSEVNESEAETTHSHSESIWNYGIVGAIVLLLIILTIVKVSRKKNRSPKVSASTAQASTSNVALDNPTIVVRRRTTSILKKQCIDDVIDNPAYMVINSSDFTPDSAVRRIFIKNTCIKDVYNLYAEDLRNTENPKEDGCMVLGRWVHEEANHTYDITLEEVIFPGDDAVFKEYELNFGGKIKLRIAEKLRKLRRETNLQYDLVCWIHSHPGLGVFFSNSDDNVQMQLKHPQHPNFLIAFVVDILTSDQEMGIFTFRKDGTMNSKGDITKMYSLEEMYKWALQSERSAFSHDNYFNILENAKLKMPACKGVELNNNSIIDLTQIVIEPETGIVGWAVGTTVDNRGDQEFVVSNIVRNEASPGAGVMGCLISLAHMSFPTIQRLIARHSGSLSFVMVYSSKQLSLTTIPVINGELLTDEQFYGDVNIDDLKIWTRRKR